MNLFDLTNDALQLQRQIDAMADGLFSDDPADVAAATAALELLITAESANRAALNIKADAWCWAIVQLRSMADARREHAKRLQTLADAAERRALALHERLVAALQRVDPDATSWELPEHRLSSRQTTAVELSAEIQDLPEEFQRVKTTISADRTALAAALKAGRIIDGATLVKRRSWRIG